MAFLGSDFFSPSCPPKVNVAIVDPEVTNNMKTQFNVDLENCVVYFFFYCFKKSQKGAGDYP